MNWAIIAGVLINSALYFAGVLAGSIWMGNPLSFKLCLTAIGITYLSYLVQALDAPKGIIIALVALSIISGGLAGIMLL